MKYLPSTVSTSLAILAVGAVCFAGFPISASSAAADTSFAGSTFANWQDAISLTEFYRSGARCATPSPQERAALYGIFRADPSDCNASSTNPTSEYDPNTIYEIQVVVHILMNDDGSLGAFTDAQVQSQIDILNEDFLALTGTNGANGNYGAIQFSLATEDPSGSPTTGITRSMNTTWFNDGGGYFNTLNWDPNRYMNIYVNNNSALGYVPFLPADSGGSLVGTAADRVVILYTTFGRDAPFMPFHLGRTGTHEVGHYLGLEHTFSGGCGTGTMPDCYTTGDMICDTNPEASPTSNGGCMTGRMTCGGILAPIDNYMDYSDDICMEQFTPEQVRRMRCTMQFYRPDVWSLVNPRVSIFTDGFESGDTTLWDSTVP